MVPVINSLIDDPTWDLVAFSQDWHPAGHVSFASTLGAELYSAVNLTYTKDGALCNTDEVEDEMSVECEAEEVEYAISQVMWPDHCVQARRRQAGRGGGVGGKRKGLS